MTETTPLSQSDERLFSGISYIFGLVVALIIWGVHHDRSRFVRFHSLQAIGLDVLFFISWVIMSGCMVVTIFAILSLMVAGLFSAAQVADPTSPSFLLAMALPLGVPMLMVIPVFLLAGTMLFVRIYAAVRVFQGCDFCLPILGKQIDPVATDG